MIVFQDKGSPSLSSSTYVLIHVRDGDDLSPLFTKDVYEASVQEDSPITVGTNSIVFYMHSNFSNLSLNVSVNNWQILPIISSNTQQK